MLTPLTSLWGATSDCYLMASTAVAAINGIVFGKIISQRTPARLRCAKEGVEIGIDINFHARQRLADSLLCLEGDLTMLK